MNDGIIKISRKELYEKVWSISMVKLSKEYGLSMLVWPRYVKNIIFLVLQGDIGPEKQPAIM